MALHPAIFVVGCLGARLALAVAALLVSRAWLRVLAVCGAGIALGFMVLYLTGWRRSGPETGGAPIWWNALRPVHALLYATFAACAWAGQRRAAAAALLVDVALGAWAWAVQRARTR